MLSAICCSYSCPYFYFPYYLLLPFARLFVIPYYNLVIVGICLVICGSCGAHGGPGRTLRPASYSCRHGRTRGLPRSCTPCLSYPFCNRPRHCMHGTQTIRPVWPPAASLRPVGILVKLGTILLNISVYDSFTHYLSLRFSRPNHCLHSQMPRFRLRHF